MSVRKEFILLALAGNTPKAELCRQFGVSRKTGYKWLKRFKEKGMLSPEAGDYYRRNILARGGTQDGLDLVKEYLGREPTMEPYLRHLGLEP